MMTTIYTLIIILILLELFESSWQKAPTLFGIIHNNYLVYQKNIFTYFLLNPSFIYSLFLAFYLNVFGIWMSSIILMKFMDIAFRLHIITKMNDGIELTSILPMDMQMNNYLRYFNVLVYPLSLIFALKSILFQ